jgi:hypothetical protein
VKPTVKSEILSAEVLCNCGSGGNSNHFPRIPWQGY